MCSPLFAQYSKAFTVTSPDSWSSLRRLARHHLASAFVMVLQDFWHGAKYLYFAAVIVVWPTPFLPHRLETHMVGVDITEHHKKSACVSEENMNAEDHTKIDPVRNRLRMWSICVKGYPQLIIKDDRLTHQLLHHWHTERLWDKTNRTMCARRFSAVQPIPLMEADDVFLPPKGTWVLVAGHCASFYHM